ncbi:MAG: 3-methyladenine DNA glycosylase [Myxococcota bacterium]
MTQPSSHRTNTSAPSFSSKWQEKPLFLDEAQWKAQQEAHRTQLTPQLEPYVTKRSHQQQDPILDFLFEYYNFSPANLMRWSPGIGVVLQGQVDSFLNVRGFAADESGAWVEPALFPQRRRKALRWITQLLEKTYAQTPFFGCFGIHEWAMVYRAEHVRHPYPLRIDSAKLAAWVESRPVVCTHFDAFRFFTPPAKPLNQNQLTRDNQPAFEQPACLHANMDLYKWAYKLTPWVGSSVVADAFQIAYRARTLDMQASPYDLRARNLAPIPVETHEGRLLYRQKQHELYTQAQPLRFRLLHMCKKLLDAVELHAL